ncbi:FUSC family protein [Sediminibacterium roseum]|uniref:FUSC family protein n=1 Tax=Sediminibacterium roseum TaxID=1978412 RepID=A0ABW9ZNL6_9BACT|nr:FUSC family membrane protein [Sediminibacterium roseum]NCI48670.1 FUSC family protein [Sediminibacterium roseum]
MDYLKEYRSFISSHYVSEGVRITAGVLIPVFILGYYDLLPVGLAIGLGALCVSITDNPGPIHHRRNGLVVCALINFVVAIIVSLVQQVPWLFMLLLPVACFVFSMIGVYGTRATSIGLAALFVLVLQTEHRYEGWQIVYNALYILSGGVWYILLSLLMNTLRPYKIIQQALGEYVMATGDYLKAKAVFFDTGTDREKNYEEILRTQIIVQEKQALVAELLFKTRSIVKESTHTGRVLMMVFMDVADLFEIAMTSHQDYEKLHRYFDDTDILTEYRHLINTLAAELDEIGIALKSGRRSGYDKRIDAELIAERKHLQQLRLERLRPDNIDGFISLRHILDSIDEIATHIRTLHQYTSYDAKLRRKKLNAPDPEDFIMHQSIDRQLIIDNLSFRSNIFRHSIRISAAVLFAYVIGLFFPIGHNYWILLAVIVILKPAYSLTRTRNFERLTGTIIGASVGALVLYLVKDKTTIMVLLAVSMIGAYSFMRKKYLVSVTLMTLYLLLMFHLLDPKDFRAIMIDRVIDTAIGSAIAIVFGYLIAPVWEHERINEYMSDALKDILKYYERITATFTGKTFDKQEAVVMRKNSWVSLANLSDTFTKMLSEPKRKQKNAKEIHQFVVANHMIASHIATLSYYADSVPQEYVTDDYRPLITATTQALQRSLDLLDDEKKKENRNLVINTDPEQIRLLGQRINQLVVKRQEELKSGQMETATRKMLSDFKSITDQFYFIYKIAVDVEKISMKLEAN